MLPSFSDISMYLNVCLVKSREFATLLIPVGLLDEAVECLEHVVSVQGSLQDPLHGIIFRVPPACSIRLKAKDRENLKLNSFNIILITESKFSNSNFPLSR